MTKTPPSSTETLLGSASSWVELLSQSTAAIESGSLDTDAEEQRSCETATKSTKRANRQKKRLPQKRRTTYDIRKQQKSDLVAEVANLENQLELLKHQLLLQQGDDTTTLRRTEAANSVLNESIQQQHVAIAGIHVMLVSQMQQNLSTFHPTHDFIRLAANRPERRATLEALKKPKLREAERFITAWSREFNAKSAVSQENRLESVDGGFSVERFDSAPLRCSSAKAAFDAIIYSMQNVDITISELFGSITIREDTDFSASDISQIRLVSTTSHGAKVESNSVVFSEFVDGPNGCYGIVVADFVDADELYPYLPAERNHADPYAVRSDLAARVPA
ncbi:Delta(3,5)-Delta(2,4)-dienoyl-CoA isomerase [Phytophthora cinnamomi]|uniref:Delta(3,5)-Delta(2,4)-dienoyl-CoA isomerase n=1 Tax=Phytophthora cinnamomi TaxID=4785 RepID=UPI003559F62A|nr:Delta(3,5)-Delta(2,4)-dienoyl-CoA isomerase [Phytophthora cinnamomi]